VQAGIYASSDYSQHLNLNVQTAIYVKH